MLGTICCVVIFVIIIFAWFCSTREKYTPTSIKAFIEHWDSQYHKGYQSIEQGIEGTNFGIAFAIDHNSEAVSRPISLHEATWIISSPEMSIRLHATFNNGVWKLDSRIAKHSMLAVAGPKDHWERSMVWTRAVLGGLKNDIDKRIAMVRGLSSFVEDSIQRAESHYTDIFGYKSNTPSDITLGINSWDLPNTISGRYYTSNHIKQLSKTYNHGIVFINYEILKNDMTKIKYYIVHELIHSLFQNTEHEGKHDDHFKTIATAMGLPTEYIGHD